MTLEKELSVASVSSKWKTVELGHMCEKIKKVKHGEQILDSEFLYLDIGSVDNNSNKVVSHKKYKWKDAPSRAQQVVQKNDILFSTVRTYLRNIALVETSVPQDQIASSGFTVLRTKKNLLHPKFLFYYVLSNEFLQPLNKLQTGSSYPAVRDKDVLSQLVPLPPFLVQQQLVSKIEELFSDLDKSIEQLKTAQQQLKVYRQSVLKWAFEGKLTNETVKDGELPKGWKVIKTGDAIETINNGYTPKKEFLFEGSGEVPFIKVYNLDFNGTLNFSKNPTFIPAAIHNKDLKRSICYPGDVLTNIVGPPLGKVSIVSSQFAEWNINQAIVLFRPNQNILSKYLSYFLQNPETIHWLESTSKATAGQFNIKVSTCREIPIPICYIEEQKQIIQEIESRLSVADKLQETITSSLKQAEAFRQGILKKAFEGRL